jgi:hypothetical protein
MYDYLLLLVRTCCVIAHAATATLMQQPGQERARDVRGGICRSSAPVFAVCCRTEALSRHADERAPLTRLLPSRLLQRPDLQQPHGHCRRCVCRLHRADRHVCAPIANPHALLSWCCCITIRSQPRRACTTDSAVPCSKLCDNKFTAARDMAGVGSIPPGATAYVAWVAVPCLLLQS